MSVFGWLDLGLFGGVGGARLVGRFDWLDLDTDLDDNGHVRGIVGVGYRANKYVSFLLDGELVEYQVAATAGADESASNPTGIWDLGGGRRIPMVGELEILEGIRPGTVAFALGFGHWAYGASDVVIDGRTIRADPRRAVGVHANAAMRVDPHLADVTLQDLVGGSAVFYDTKVRLVPV